MQAERYCTHTLQGCIGSPETRAQFSVSCPSSSWFESNITPVECLKVGANLHGFLAYFSAMHSFLGHKLSMLHSIYGFMFRNTSQGLHHSKHKLTKWGKGRWTIWKSCNDCFFMYSTSPGKQDQQNVPEGVFLDPPMGVEATPILFPLSPPKKLVAKFPVIKWIILMCSGSEHNASTPQVVLPHGQHALVSSCSPPVSTPHQSTTQCNHIWYYLPTIGILGPTATVSWPGQNKRESELLLTFLSSAAPLPGLQVKEHWRDPAAFLCSNSWWLLQTVLSWTGRFPKMILHKTVVHIQICKLPASANSILLPTFPGHYTVYIHLVCVFLENWWCVTTLHFTDTTSPHVPSLWHTFGTGLKHTVHVQYHNTPAIKRVVHEPYYTFC